MIGLEFEPKFRNRTFNHLTNCSCVFLKSVLKKFAKFTGNTFWPATLLKKRLPHSCFPGNFVKFFSTPFLHNTSGWMLLFITHGVQQHTFVAMTTIKLLSNRNNLEFDFYFRGGYSFQEYIYSFLAFKEIFFISYLKFMYTKMWTSFGLIFWYHICGKKVVPLSINSN